MSETPDQPQWSGPRYMTSWCKCPPPQQSCSDLLAGRTGPVTITCNQCGTSVTITLPE